MSEPKVDYIATSAHCWGNDECDLSIKQALASLQEGDHRSISYNLHPQFALDHGDLIAAYLQTIFWLDGLDCAVRIGRYNLAAHRLVASIEQTRASRKGMVLLSASNPNGQSLTHGKNIALHAALKDRMRSQNLLLDEGRGIGQFPANNSELFWEPLCAVGPLSEREAEALAYEYRQIAVVFTGTLDPAKLIFSGLMPVK